MFCSGITPTMGTAHWMNHVWQYVHNTWTPQLDHISFISMTPARSTEMIARSMHREWHITSAWTTSLSTGHHQGISGEPADQINTSRICDFAETLLEIQDVYYQPTHAYTLISCSQLEDAEGTGSGMIWHVIPRALRTSCWHVTI